MYWVSGKPGSSKSTLLKYFFDDECFHEGRKSWAGSRPLVTASFISWNAGTELQKSLEGMLRSLLHLAIEKCPKLLSVLLHDQVSTFRERVDSEGSMKRLGLCLANCLKRREIH